MCVSGREGRGCEWMGGPMMCEWMGDGVDAPACGRDPPLSPLLQCRGGRGGRAGQRLEEEEGKDQHPLLEARWWLGTPTYTHGC